MAAAALPGQRPFWSGPYQRANDNNVSVKIARRQPTIGASGMKRLTNNKRWTIPIVLVVSLLAFAWTQGTFDNFLWRVHLNATDCSQNAFGAVLCGKDLDRWQAQVKADKRAEKRAAEAEKRAKVQEKANAMAKVLKLHADFENLLLEVKNEDGGNLCARIAEAHDIAIRHDEALDEA